MSVEKGRKSRENENPASCRNRSAPARLSAPETRSPRTPAAGRRRPARRRRRLAAAAAPAEDRGRLPCVSRPSSSPPQHNQTEADGVGTGLCSVGRRHTRAPPRADRPRAALTTVTPAPNRPIKRHRLLARRRESMLCAAGGRSTAWAQMEVWPFITLNRVDGIDGGRLHPLAGAPTDGAGQYRAASPASGEDREATPSSIDPWCSMAASAAGKASSQALALTGASGQAGREQQPLTAVPHRWQAATAGAARRWRRTSH